jgi:hypothetical protein
MNVTVSEGSGAAGSQAGNASPEASLAPDGDGIGLAEGVTLALEGLAEPGVAEGGACVGASWRDGVAGVEMQADRLKTMVANVAQTDPRIVR